MMEGIGSLGNVRIDLLGTRVSRRVSQETGASKAEKPVDQAEGSGPLGGAEQVAALAEEMNQILRQIEGNFSVSVDKATGMVVVRITDGKTGEVVKQIPPQQILDASVSVEKIIGLLIDDKA